jgi:hypothetical protein
MAFDEQTQPHPRLDIDLSEYDELEDEESDPLSGTTA